MLKEVARAAVTQANLELRDAAIVICVDFGTVPPSVVIASQVAFMESMDSDVCRDVLNLTPCTVVCGAIPTSIRRSTYMIRAL